MLPIETCVKEALWVELFEQRLGVPGHACRKHDDFIVRCYSFEELVAVGPLARIHLLVHHLVGDVRDVYSQNYISI